MARVVQKYGGSSVADAEKIRAVARRIAATRLAGNEVVVVVSAMGDTTDELVELANSVSPDPPGRELDMLLTAGERIAMSLLAMAIANHDLEARSFTGSQAGVITNSSHGKARIQKVTPGRILGALEEGAIAIVAGFQGVSYDTKDVTTLGRGGSDTTAVALAAALEADVCEIYTDVDGVFSADPRLVPRARHVPHLAYEEMMELAACGSKVLHLRAVEYGRQYGMPLRVRSSFSNRPGTLISGSISEIASGPGQTKEGTAVEQPIISGVAHDLSEAKITVVGVPDRPGEAARLFRALADVEVNVDMIVQNVSAAETGLTDISFTAAKGDAAAAMGALEAARDLIGFRKLRYDDGIGKVSVVGAGMRSHPGVSATFFEALGAAGVNVEIISTSEIRISIVCREADVPEAVRAVHAAFGLDAEEEATVYAGTGR